MNQEITNTFIYLMNLVEKFPVEVRKDMVIEKVQEKYPYLSKKLINDTIEVLIGVSKASVPIVFNKQKNKCCIIQ